MSIGGEGTARVCADGRKPLSMDQIKERIDAWAAMRVTGILLDEAEYGFGCSRQRQTDAIDYVHSRGLRAFINGYNPDDVFSNAPVGVAWLPNANAFSTAMNPNGLGTHLGRNDRYLLEHFQVMNGGYVEDWTRADLASRYSDRYGTLIATIATTKPTDPLIHSSTTSTNTNSTMPGGQPFSMASILRVGENNGSRRAMTSCLFGAAQIRDRSAAPSLLP